jgi:hypothetical protein
MTSGLNETAELSQTAEILTRLLLEVRSFPIASMTFAGVFLVEEISFEMVIPQAYCRGV